MTLVAVLLVTITGCLHPTSVNQGKPRPFDGLRLDASAEIAAHPQFTNAVECAPDLMRVVGEKVRQYEFILETQHTR